MKATFNHKIAQRLVRPWQLRIWMLTHLPMGLVSGMSIESLDENSCKVVLKDRLWIRNPFRSVFWAVMGMAAELSSGSLVYAWASGTNSKFILTGIEGKFLKKLRGKSSYFCQSGQEVRRSLDSLENPGDQIVLIMPVIAQDQAGDTVAEFQFHWQFKKPDN